MPPSFSPCLLAFSLGPWWGKPSRQGVCDRKNYFLPHDSQEAGTGREEGAVDKTRFCLQWQPYCSVSSDLLPVPHSLKCLLSPNPTLNTVSITQLIYSWGWPHKLTISQMLHLTIPLHWTSRLPHMSFWGISLDSNHTSRITHHYSPNETLGLQGVLCCKSYALGCVVHPKWQDCLCHELGCWVLFCELSPVCFLEYKSEQYLQMWDLLPLALKRPRHLTFILTNIRYGKLMSKWLKCPAHLGCHSHSHSNW